MSDREKIEKARALLLSGNSDSIDSGIKIIKKMAENGDGVAMYAVATWHINNSYGYKRNKIIERKLLWSACECLVPEAFYDLGVHLLHSDDFKNVNKAFILFGIGSILGDVDCMKQMSRYAGDVDIYNRDRRITKIIRDIARNK